MPAKINPICIHPMFGPGVKSIKGQNIISVPIKDAKKELTVTKSLFEGANFVTIDAVEHDKKIAVILGLTHLMNLVFANIVSKDENVAYRKNVRYNFQSSKDISRKHHDRISRINRDNHCKSRNS